MTLEPIEFSESFASKIAGALGSDAQQIQEQCAQNICQSWHFVDDGIVIGYLVTRLEIDTLVCVAYEGKRAVAVGDFLKRIAEYKNLKWVRWHTQKPGVNKLLARFNPEPMEYVMRVKCHGW